jgi:ABC-type sugar transport system ATPase subunit
MNHLRVQGIRKSVGDFVLEANFSIQSGERAVLTGKSGSGKTTLLRILAGLESFEDGRISLGDQDVTHFTPQKREIGFVFQDLALFQHMNIMENITFGLRMRGIRRKEREQEGVVWLDRVGLKSRLHVPIHKLSGGEKQRVAFVRALIWKPQLLLLDEPFSALDIEMRSTLRSLLVELHQFWPVPMILVTHDEVDADTIATSRLKIERTENQAKVLLM